jgi:FAD/FMN-containing dehydrogenase
LDPKKEQLMSVVRREDVLDDPEVLAAYASDESFASSNKPAFVVRPESMDEVQRVVRWANETLTPLVPVSSGTPHFYGDTVPSGEGAVIVELFKMNHILNVDRRNKIVVIEPGVTYGQLGPVLAKEGLMVTSPLLPRPNKSMIASLLERQPTMIPRYNFSLTEPLRNCGVVWGNGEITYTGEAGNMPYSLDEQWRMGGMQVDPKGPAQTDFFRLLTGAQGSMGIVVWASIKCELLPSARKLFFVPAEKLDDLIDFSYKVQRLRLGDEVMLVNNSQFANMVGSNGSRKDDLPPWVMLIGIGGRALFPEEKVEVQEKDLGELASQFGLKLASEIGEISDKQMLEIIGMPSAEPYWKLRRKGACQEIFFQTTLDRIPKFIETSLAVAETSGYPASEIGIYIQPQHQGVTHHCEFNLPYDPEDSKETGAVKETYSKASESLIGQGAYFSRPYGAWADMAFDRDSQSTTALKKIKKIFDPNNVMNPGKLCF